MDKIKRIWYNISMEKKKRKCPYCGAEEHQVNNGKNPTTGTQKVKCMACNRVYTPNNKKIAYSEEQREQAIKMFYSGVSARGVGRAFGMSKANVLNWIKKNR